MARDFFMVVGKNVTCHDFVPATVFHSHRAVSGKVGLGQTSRRKGSTKLSSDCSVSINQEKG